MLLKKKLLPLIVLGLILIPSISSGNKLESSTYSSNRTETNESMNNYRIAKILVKNNGDVIVNDQYDIELEDTTDVQLYGTIVNVKRNLDDIVIEHNKTNEYIEAIIKDKYTDEILESYREEIATINNENDIQLKTLKASIKVGPAMVTTTCVAEIWSSGSFRQINAKPVNEVSFPGNEGNYVLEDEMVHITTTEYPTMYVSCNISGNIVAFTDNIVGGAFSAENLRRTGFDISTNSSKNYKAVRWYKDVISFRVE